MPSRPLCSGCHGKIHKIRVRFVDGEYLISGLVFDWRGIDRVRVVKED